MPQVQLWVQMLSKLTKMRKKSKLEVYIERFLHPKKIIEGEKSRYYHFGANVVRISDHLSFCPERFTLTIVLNQNYSDYYVMYTNTNTQLHVATYREMKDIMKAVKLLSVIDGTLYRAQIPGIILENSSDTILGVQKEKFTAGRLQIIEALTKKTIKENKKNSTRL